MAGEDFVQVKLSAAGEKMAGEHGVLRIANGRREFSFEVGKSVRVERAYEWNAWLSRVNHKGEPIFELDTSTLDAPASTEETTHA